MHEVLRDFANLSNPCWKSDDRERQEMSAVDYKLMMEQPMRSVSRPLDKTSTSR